MSRSDSQVPRSLWAACVPSRARCIERADRSGGSSSPVDSGGGVERWVLEHAGPVFDQLDATVEGAVVDHLEGDVRVAVVDAFSLPWRR